MTGTVASHFHDNDPLTLPSGSRYGPIEKIIQGHATGEAGPTPMPAADFAEKIVGDIVGDKSRGLVWKGPNSSSMGAIFHHGPQFLCVSPFLPGTFARFRVEEADLLFPGRRIQ